MSSPSPFFELLSWWRAALGMDFATFYKFFIKRETVSPSERQAAKLAGLTDAEIDAGLTEHDKTMILEKLDQAERDQIARIEAAQAAARIQAESDQIARIEAAQAAARTQAESDQAAMNEIAYMTARDQATRDAQAALTKAAGDQATRDAQAALTKAARDKAAGQQAVLEQAALAAYNARNQAIQTSNVPQTAYVSPVVAPAPSLLPDETWPVNAIGQKPTGYGRTSTGVIAWYYPDEE